MRTHLLDDATLGDRRCYGDVHVSHVGRVAAGRVLPIYGQIGWQQAGLDVQVKHGCNGLTAAVNQWNGRCIQVDTFTFS